MSAVIRRTRARLSAVPSQSESAVVTTNDIKIARQRMRHLAHWNVEPVPAMHSAAGTLSEPLGDDARERLRRIALRILAVQMWHTTARSALQ